MDNYEDRFLSYNKLLEEKINQILHHVECRLDKLCEISLLEYTDCEQTSNRNKDDKSSSLFSHNTCLTFQKPYIRDIRSFSGPSNQDVKLINQLAGSENIDHLIKNKIWTRTSENQLRNAILDNYAQLHIVKLIKQKNALHKQYLDTKDINKSDLEHKFRLIDEQIEQVRQRKEERIFVPADRDDSNIDWCSISAKLSNTYHDASDCRLMWVNKVHWTINNNIWSGDEDSCLLDAIKKHGTNDWDSVAGELANGRLSWQCCSRYHQEYANLTSHQNPISEDDADKMIEVINLCRIGNYVPWYQVMYFIHHHSLSQVKYQWSKHSSGMKSSQQWSHQEDTLLLNLVDKFGPRDWSRISNYIPGRSNKSCRERYTMRLKYSERAVGTWLRNEDQNLLALVEKFGTNWTMIAYHFPERNNHQLRNRYELLRNERYKAGSTKRRKIRRDISGNLFIHIYRRFKHPSDQEIDDTLQQILSSYQEVKPNAKSLVCRSAQDEILHQHLVRVLESSLLGESLKPSLLNLVMKRTMDESMGAKMGLLSPCLATLKGFKAWSLQQNYLNKLADHDSSTEICASDESYLIVLKIVISLFLWPAILSKIKAPSIDASSFRSPSIIVRDSKNLYKIREIQKNLISSTDD